MLELISFILVSIVIVSAIITAASFVMWIFLIDDDIYIKIGKVSLVILLTSATIVAIFYSLLELYRYGPLV